jgi:hypothetical protein
MAQHVSFTVKDVCSALGDLCRSRAHAWVQLPPFSQIETMERSARRFDIADLLTLAVLQTLEDRFCVKSRLLGRLSGGIHQYLSEPKTASLEEWIFIRLEDGITRRIEASPVSEPGWILDMAEERNRINVYLGITPPQRELALVSGLLALTR